MLSAERFEDSPTPKASMSHSKAASRPAEGRPQDSALTPPLASLFAGPQWIESPARGTYLPLWSFGRSPAP